MGHIYLSIIFFASFLLQVSLLGNARVFGLVPNLILILIVFFGFKREIRKVLPYAFIYGVLLDILFESFFGFHLLLFFFTAWIASSASKEGKSVTLSRVLIMIFVSSLVYSIYLGLGIYFQEVALTFRTLLFLFGQIVINMFIAFVLFGGLDRLSDFLDRIDNISKQKVKI